MNAPLFYHPNVNESSIQLDEETSKHIHVLRMQKGQELFLTDGQGRTAKAVIADDNRKKTFVEVQSIKNEAPKSRKVSIAISLVKNSSRFEWFLEKATEIGVSEIIPFLCERTEKEKFRHDRMQTILISAMLQSQQTWLPVLHQPTSFEKIISDSSHDQRFIAHCLPGEKQHLSSVGAHRSSIILIGPEGDFTSREIEHAMSQTFAPVALGSTRLRTETAGIVAAALLVNA